MKGNEELCINPHCTLYIYTWQKVFKTTLKMAAKMDDSAVIAELNKFKKQELIELILYKRVPSQYVDNVVIVEVCKKWNSGCNCVENNAFSSLVTESVESCDKPVCIRTKYKLEATGMERDMQKRLIYQLEKRAAEQEMIIDILRKGNKLINPIKYDNKRENNGQLPASDGTSRKPTNTTEVIETKTYADKTAGDNTVNQNKPPGRGVNEPDKNLNIVNRNQLRSSKHEKGTESRGGRQIVGNNKDSTLSAIPRRGYLYVSRLSPETEVNDVLQHLRKSAPHISFNVECISSGTASSSFRVDYPLECIDTVYSPTLWPAGATVRRFFFDRTKRSKYPANVPGGNFQDASVQQQSG